MNNRDHAAFKSEKNTGLTKREYAAVYLLGEIAAVHIRTVIKAAERNDGMGSVSESLEAAKLSSIGIAIDWADGLFDELEK